MSDDTIQVREMRTMDEQPTLQNPTLPVSNDAAAHLFQALRESLKGCRHCDYDEAEGGLFCHCAACQLKVTRAAWELVNLRGR